MSLADSETYQKLADLLRHQGWKRDQDDNRLKYLVTSYRPTKQAGPLRLVASVSQGGLRGESASEGSLHGGEPVIYRGQDQSPNQYYFEVMNQLALQLKALAPGSRIDYSTSPPK